MCSKYTAYLNRKGTFVGIMNKKALRKKLIEVGGSTALSRVLGVVREKLMATFVGATFGADAFFTAFKIPNTLRKVFAEGALSAAFIRGVYPLLS